MSAPLVCAIMLTRDRAEMARHAVECWRKQTYENKRLFILDTGEPESFPFTSDIEDHRIAYVFHPAHRHANIGSLRNIAIGTATCSMSEWATGWKKEWDTNIGIFVHWDDDEWCHPNRIAEQAALLQSSGKQCVGYNEMLFWRQRQGINDMTATLWGESYLYRNPNPRYALGTSLCYWRSAWEAHPFPDTSQGEDTAFTRALDSDCLGVSSLGDCGCHDPAKPHEPRMVASIHGGNASTEYTEEKLRIHYTRTPHWDDYCRKVMACA